MDFGYKSDVPVVKNYPTLKEMDLLNRIVKDRLFESDFYRLLRKLKKKFKAML